MFAIVTDSTSDTPIEKLQEMGVAIAPLDIRFGDTTYVDGFELGPEKFYEMLDAFRPDLPKSSCPAPGAFAHAYRDAVAAGADGVVCITMSSGASGTHNSSVVAAQHCEDLDVPIRCVDSKATAGLLSIMIEKACQMRDAGASADECADHLERIVEESEIYIAMESIEYVLKGGKIAEGGDGVDTSLAMKPILTLRKSDGGVNVISKPRGPKGQAREMVEFAKRYAAAHPGAVARFSQANSFDRIDKIKEALDAEGISYCTDTPGWICGLIGVYVGNHSYIMSLVPAELL